MITVMVAEDSLEQNSMYCKFLTKDKDIEIISRTTDGMSTLKEYQSNKPDVLLLDLGMPILNGLEVIDNLSVDINERKKCNIIILTGNNSLRHKITNTSKVYKVISKPCDFDEVISAIKEIGSSEKSLSEKEVKNLLQKFGLNIYSKGSRYILNAILLAYDNVDFLSNISELYKIIAYMNNEKTAKVQRSIRSSVDIINSRIPQELLRSFFHIYDKNLITPKYFFTVVVDYFKEI